MTQWLYKWFLDFCGLGAGKYSFRFLSLKVLSDLWGKSWRCWILEKFWRKMLYETGDYMVSTDWVMESEAESVWLGWSSVGRQTTDWIRSDRLARSPQATGLPSSAWLKGSQQSSADFVQIRSWPHRALSFAVSLPLPPPLPPPICWDGRGGFLLSPDDSDLFCTLSF